MNSVRKQLVVRISTPKIILLVLVLCAYGLSGCTVLRLTKLQPKAQVNSLQLTNAPTGPVPIGVLQQQVMRFADTYAATIAQACDEISAATTNADIKLLALRWKLGQATSAYTDATGQNPAINALDILVLVSMARMVVDGYGFNTYSNEILPLIEAQGKMETNAWTLAGGVLKPLQIQELWDLIQEWRVKNPDMHYIGQVRFREFVSALGRMPSQSATAPTSIFSLLYLDPLAGLDPTAAAIEETRELGERLMYYTQRMPSLLSWQAEVLTYQIANQPASQQVLNDASSIAASADIFAKTAQQLPQLINDQRQAAIQQILDGLTAQGDKSLKLLTDARLTINSASVAATNIDAAIQSLTEFVQYVNPTNTISSSSSSNNHPFNVLDYGTAATQIGAASEKLKGLLSSVNDSVPQLEKISHQTTANASLVVQRAFWLGVALILVLLAGSVLAGLIYRVLAKKLPKN